MALYLFQLMASIALSITRKQRAIYQTKRELRVRTNTETYTRTGHITM